MHALLRFMDCHQCVIIPYVYWVCRDLITYGIVILKLSAKCHMSRVHETVTNSSQDFTFELGQCLRGSPVFDTERYLYWDPDRDKDEAKLSRSAQLWLNFDSEVSEPRLLYIVVLEYQAWFLQSNKIFVHRVVTNQVSQGDKPLP